MYSGYILRFAIPFLAVVSAASAQTETVLIRSAKPYTSLVRAIETRGGRVTRQFERFGGIAAEIPRAQLEAITAIAGRGNVSKDLVVPAPVPVDTLRGRNLTSTGEENRVTADSVQPLGAAEVASIARVTPSAYLLNNSINNASALHASGITGAGVVVAVIDSGIRPGFPHISLDGSVIGCLDFVGDGLGCSNPANGSHGTIVAGMISANVIFSFSPASTLRNAVLAECPSCFSNPPVNTAIPMIGTAPLSSIYALRVFGPTGGAPTSRVLAAIDQVIDLRAKFNAGDPSGVNIKVCNMSLGGSTLLPAGDLFAAAADSLLAADIVPVIAAGNAGPATLTVGSPASAVGALTVGAASMPHNERIVRRLQFGPVNGPLYRPFLGVQTAYFSSRGPNADGRTDPDVSANGFYAYGQGDGSAGSIIFASGTSFSTPTVAGIAAILRQAVPTATARQVRNAIVAGANAAGFADGSDVLDRGAGYVDAAAARSLLASGAVPDSIAPPPKPNSNVKVNIEKNTTLNVRDGFVRTTIANLKPGQRSDLLYRVGPNTKQVVIDLSNVTPALPPAAQNQLFGDDILLAVHTAKTSEIGDGGDYPVFSFTKGGQFVLTDPEPGIIRVSVNGDWTNAGTISANVAIISLTESTPQKTTQGKIETGQTIAVPVTIPAGTAKAEFRLSWREDWGSYPANDLDLYIFAPNGFAYFGAATLNSPERLAIDNPPPGVWTLFVVGYEINSGDDKYELRVALDGNVVQ